MAHYFPHDTDAMKDEKLVKVMINHGLEGIGCYWCLVEMLYSNNGKVDHDYNCIAFALHTNRNLVKSIIEDYGLFQVVENTVQSQSVNKRMSEIEKRSESARRSAEARWKNNNPQENNANAYKKECERNANAPKTDAINKIKENKEKKENIKERHKYGTFKNVLLTDEQHKKISDKYGDKTQAVIDFFSLKKESKGYKYKNDYAAMVSWGFSAYEKESAEQKTESYTNKSNESWKNAEQQNLI